MSTIRLKIGLLLIIYSFMFLASCPGILPQPSYPVLYAASIIDQLDERAPLVLPEMPRRGDEEDPESDQTADRLEYDVDEEPSINNAAETYIPLSYVWKEAHTIRFRTEVTITNGGSVASSNIIVALPMLENNSPYQTTRLDSTNYPIVETSGRVCTFVIDRLDPGTSTSIIADYTITMHPVSLSSTSETIEKARLAFNNHAGSGNCHTLAVNFVNECQAMGLTARVVTGFARIQRTSVTSGSLKGSRHSWAEFYVDDLGWVPVDLTFQYFAGLPFASHIVETYADRSITVYFTGSTLSIDWHNLVL